MTDASREKVIAAITSMAADLKEIVEIIETGDPRTQGNYDKYSLLIDELSQGKGSTYKYAVALALMEAGANVAGVRAAVSLTTGEPM